MASGRGARLLNDALILVVPDDFAARPGAELEASGLVLCSPIARGQQGAVWSLALSPEIIRSPPPPPPSPLPTPTQSPPPLSPPPLSPPPRLEPLPGVVAKISHSGALISEIEREWRVGLRLNTLAVEVEAADDEIEGQPRTAKKKTSSPSAPAFPHGFATMGMAICTASGAFRGFLMERVRGRTLAEVVQDPAFADAGLLRRALAATFAALDAAQGALGFRHYDLRPPNVILYFEEGEGEEEGEDDKKPLRAKIIDFGLALFDDFHAAGPDAVVSVSSSSSSSSSSSLSPASRRRRVLSRPPPLPPTENNDALPLLPPPSSALPRRTRPFFPFVRADASELDPPLPSFLEAVHRAAWRRRSDVYHLLLALAEQLDGRVWPRADVAVVQALMSFVNHVTGVRPRAFFREEVEELEAEAKRAAAAATATMTAADLLAFRSGFGRHGRRAHALRRWGVRLRAWVTPRSPMITAAEALTAPLFTQRQSCRVRFV